MVRDTRIKDQESSTKNQGPRTKDQESRTKNQGPRIKDQEPRTKNQGPRIKDQESRTKNQESRIKNQESRIKCQGSRFKVQTTDCFALLRTSQHLAETLLMICHLPSPICHLHLKNRQLINTLFITYYMTFFKKT